MKHTITQTKKKIRGIIKCLLITFFLNGICVNNSNGQTTVSTISSSGTFTVPPGVSSVTAYLWGGGGGGGGSVSPGTYFSNGGGGGGGACAFATFSVSSGQVYTITIGAGGTAGVSAGGSGGTTTVTGPAGTWTAGGGAGGSAATTTIGASAAGGLGSTVGTGPGVTENDGGNGSAGKNGVSNSTGITGTGGGGGGSFANGTTPPSDCQTPSGGGNGIYTGGNGGKTPNCGVAINTTGATGGVRGGGGGGDNDWSGANPGGPGGAGQVVLVYSNECVNSSNYPAASFAAPAPGGTYTITNFQYQQEYNHMTGAVAGHTFISTASIAGTFITVRSGASNGPRVASGITPLTWTASVGGNYYIHYNTNNSCGTAAIDMTTTIQNTFAPNNFTAAPNAPNTAYGNMILLSDGSVICKNQVGGANGRGIGWDKLTPNAFGNYASGTWTSIASMTDDRLWYSSQVLKDGRVYVAGAEYPNAQRLTEIYNPLTNAWTTVTVPGAQLGGANSEILEDGRVLQGVLGGVGGGPHASLIFNPVTMTYATGSNTLGDNDESIWVKLPDNSILFVDVCSTSAERFDPVTQTWVSAGTLPVSVWSYWGCEPGAAFLLPDGRAFFIGGSGATAFYTPSSNSWAQGPNLPAGMGAQDARGVMLTNGKILTSLCPAATGPSGGNPDLLFTSPTTYWLFDYLTETFTAIPAPDGTASNIAESYKINYLPLPNGTVLCNELLSNKYYVYTPSGTPLAAGKPTVSNVIQNTCTEFTLTGTKFTGISEGGQNEDDVQMGTNFPIVRLISGANVYFCRTHDWNSRGVQRGLLPDTTQFTLPASLPAGTYSLVVSANGISSDPVPFTPGPYLSSTLTPSAICSGTSFIYTCTSLTNNATFSWTRGAVNGISNAAVVVPQSGNILEVLNNTTSSPISVIYSVTITAGTCIKTQNVTVVVNPPPFMNLSASPPPICAGASTSLNANASLFSGNLLTPLSGGNGSAGNAFNITANKAITIHYFSMSQSAGSAEIWYIPGGFAGPTLSSNTGWIFIGSAAVVASTTGTVSLINVDCNITIPAGQTYGFVVVNNTGNIYSNGTAFGNTLVTNPDLTIKQGCGGTGYGGVFSFTNTPRSFNGNVSYSSPVQSLTYAWTPTSSLNSSTSSNPFASPVTTTTYTVTSTNGNNCHSTGTVTVPVNPAPIVSASASISPVCTGSSSSLSAVGGGPADSYLFSASSGVFTQLAGGTSVPDVQADDATSSALPIGFTFYFEGRPYATLNASSNGILVLGNSNSDYTNALSSSSGPIMAPLWDDLNGAAGAASYLTTGSIGNRIFTFQFLNWIWYYNRIAPTISFQVKLYEANGKVEYYYRQESGSLGGAESATIGIGGLTPGHFLSLNNSSASPSVSSYFETTTINSKPATGQVYTFIPSTTFNQSISYAWSPSTFLSSTSGPSVNATNVTATTIYSVTATAAGCISAPGVVTLTATNCGLTLNLKAYIEGFYSGSGLMNNSGSGGCLFVNGIPGASSTDADTIFISAMDAVTFAQVDKVAGILQTNGNVSVVFSNAVVVGNSYYLKINHRNSIETWSASPVPMLSTTTYNFTNAQSKAYGGNMTQTFDNLYWAIYSGDISDASLGVGYQDGVIESQDYSDMENAVFSTMLGYHVEDLTGDGIVESADYSIMGNNVYFTVYSQHP